MSARSTANRLPRCTPKGWTVRARLSTYRRPPGCGWSTNCPPGRHPRSRGLPVRQDPDQIVAVPCKQAETNKLYEELIARLALRTLAEVFDAAPVTLVAGIMFNGYVSAKDRTTGQPVRPLLLSVHADRDALGKIVLDEPALDPTACLRGYLNAVISPHPCDLEPVKPVLQFDMSRYKFVDDMSVVAGLDSRPDLLALKPVEFEHLIRELFEAVGLKSCPSSRPDGSSTTSPDQPPFRLQGPGTNPGSAPGGV
jgi:restriction system protein